MMPFHSLVKQCCSQADAASDVQHAGQLYIPVMNYVLMVLCIIVVATFQSSARLGRAYGALTMLCFTPA